MPKGTNESYALLNVTLLDGSEHMEPRRGMAVITEGSKISWVGPAACAQVPSGAREMDMGGACLMPGLVNMHAHLCGSGKPVSAGNAGDLMRRLNNAPGRAPTFSPFRYVFMSGQLRDARHPGAVVG